jgi:hypothetical protein
MEASGAETKTEGGAEWLLIHEENQDLDEDGIVRPGGCGMDRTRHMAAKSATADRMRNRTSSAHEHENHRC